ncbi:hypothetical protein [Nostocoides vanveenii]|uniref:Uncharacterized protein n=1 Tax=Nostocoides vanveenii TaxID=330835 RepID=A0ABN2KNL2_9MICO
MSDDQNPGSWVNRLLGWSLLLLLAAMALEGTVAILRAIWAPLTILLGVVSGAGLASWLVARGRRF